MHKNLWHREITAVGHAGWVAMAIRASGKSTAHWSWRASKGGILLRFTFASSQVQFWGDLRYLLELCCLFLSHGSHFENFLPNFVTANSEFKRLGRCGRKFVLGSWGDSLICWTYWKLFCATDQEFSVSKVRSRDVIYIYIDIYGIMDVFVYMDI